MTDTGWGRAFALLSIGSLAVMAAVSPEYGITWDEPAQDRRRLAQALVERTAISSVNDVAALLRREVGPRPVYVVARNRAIRKRLRRLNVFDRTYSHDNVAVFALRDR